MVNYDMGYCTFRCGEYHIWTHELFGRPAYVLAVAETKKGKWKLSSVVKHFCKVAERRLPYQKPVTDEEVAEIIKLGQEFEKPKYPDAPYLTTGALPYHP